MTNIVTLKHISHSYDTRPQQQVLNDCNLTVNAGDFVTLVGPSGSGKSTLLNLIGLLDTPTSGSYLLHGEDVTTASDRYRTRLRGSNIGFVFQDFQLLAEQSSLHNVMLADLYHGVNQATSRENALQHLDRVGLSSVAQQPATTLSGGQRQRVAIARALAAHPTLLLCDEPTGNLDSVSAEAILELFCSLNREGVTIMLITHDPQVARVGNRRLSIRDGVLTEHPAVTL